MQQRPIEKHRYSVEPWWAIAYDAYFRKVPNHRGKSRILSCLHRVGLRRGTPFLWRMNNGNYVAIAPAEGYAPWSVGWTCFRTRSWEHHIERLLLSNLKRGDKAFDIGANIGYFSAVMARQVGPEGHVWSFEPVPATYEQLEMCREHNGFDQMTSLPFALGDKEAMMKMHFKPSMMGSASLHNYFADDETKTADVHVTRLDDLWLTGQVGSPSIIKIDVEGHEFNVFAGAGRLLAEARPRIIMEYNQAAAKAAGWSLSSLASRLRAYAPYRFSRVHEDGTELIDPDNYHVADGAYVDLFVTVGEP